MDNDLLQTALNYCYFYLKFRPRTKKEVIDYLIKKSERFHFTQEIIDEAITQLEEQKFVDDQKFVEWFVEQRSLTKPKSEFVLRGELLRFGVDRDLINEYFENNELNEDDLAYKTMLKRWNHFKHLPAKERLEKSTNFLLRRGFSFEIVRKIINQMEENF